MDPTTQAVINQAATIEVATLATWGIPIMGGVLTVAGVIIWYYIKQNKVQQKERDDRQDNTLSQLTCKFEAMRDKYVTHDELKEIKDDLNKTIQEGFESVRELFATQVQLECTKAIQEHERKYHQD